jgi:hypothetical protein
MVVAMDLLHMFVCGILQVLDEDGSRYIELPEFAKLYQDQVGLSPCRRFPEPSRTLTLLSSDVT